MPHSVNGTVPTMNEQAPGPEPIAQNGSEWADAEARYFADIRLVHQKQDDEDKHKYEIKHARITTCLNDARRVKLDLEARLRAAEDRLAAQEARLAALVSERQNHVANVTVSRNKEFYDMQEYFRRNREEGVEFNLEALRELQAVPAQAKLSSGMAAANGNQDLFDLESINGEDDEHADPNLTGATIWHVDGTFIGAIKRLPQKNALVEILLDLPVKRKIKIRPGRKFTEDNLPPIYEPTRGTAKYPKWTACMIQAVGEVAAQPCLNCSKNYGAFSSCVRLKGELFPRCANCEYTRQGCHPGPPPQSQNGAEAAEATTSSTDTDMRETSSGPEVSLEKTAKNSASSAPLRRKPSKDLANNLTSTPGRDNTAGPATAGPATAGGKADSPAYTWTEDDMHPDRLTNPAIPFKHDGKVYTYPEFMEGVPLEKITSDHPYWDPKWKDPVELTRTSLAAAEVKYQNSLATEAGQKESGIREPSNTTKYINLRQVRRGEAILDFLQDAPSSPYQLVGKRWMQPSIVQYDTLFRIVKTLRELGGFCIKVSPLDWLRNRLYEIQVELGDAFNLRAVLKDLYHDRKVAALRVLSGKPNVGRPVVNRGEGGTGSPRKRNRAKRKEGPMVGDGSPRPAKRARVEEAEDPIRAQLQALVEKQGQREAKLQAQAQAQAQGQTQGQSQTEPASSQTEMRSQDHDQLQQELEDLAQSLERETNDEAQTQEQPQEDPSGQERIDQTYQDKREVAHWSELFAGGQSSQNLGNADEGDGDYTDKDSMCGESLDEDDYRVRQVRSREYMSEAKSLHYWHATPFDGGPSLDLHMLRDDGSGTTQWFMYEPPVDLNLAIDDVLRVGYHPDSLVVHVQTRDRRGALMALLKRERTKKRLLKFWRENGKELSKMSPEELMREWDLLAQTAEEVTDTGDPE